MATIITLSPHSDVAMLGQIFYFFSTKSVRMVHAKNYGTMNKFVKVMPTIISPANTAYMYE